MHIQSRQEEKQMSNFDYLTDEISSKSTNPLRLGQLAGKSQIALMV